MSQELVYAVFEVSPTDQRRSKWCRDPNLAAHLHYVIRNDQPGLEGDQARLQSFLVMGYPADDVAVDEIIEETVTAAWAGALLYSELILPRVEPDPGFIIIGADMPAHRPSLED